MDKNINVNINQNHTLDFASNSGSVQLTSIKTDVQKLNLQNKVEVEEYDFSSLDNKTSSNTGNLQYSNYNSQYTLAMIEHCRTANNEVLNERTSERDALQEKFNEYLEAIREERVNSTMNSFDNLELTGSNIAFIARAKASLEQEKNLNDDVVDISTLTNLPFTTINGIAGDGTAKLEGTTLTISMQTSVVLR